jgi:hypothetical protein
VRLRRERRQEPQLAAVQRVVAEVGLRNSPSDRDLDAIERVVVAWLELERPGEGVHLRVGLDAAEKEQIVGYSYTNAMRGKVTADATATQP